jgi:hypothetical protein
VQGLVLWPIPYTYIQDRMALIRSSEMVTEVDFNIFFSLLREVWTIKSSSSGLELGFHGIGTSGAEFESAVAAGLSSLGSFETSVPPCEK